MPGYFQSPAEIEYGKKKSRCIIVIRKLWGPGEPGSSRRCSGSCLTLLSSPAPKLCPCSPPARISCSLAAIRSFPESLGVSQVIWGSDLQNPNLPEHAGHGCVPAGGWSEEWSSSRDGWGVPPAAGGVRGRAQCHRAQLGTREPFRRGQEYAVRFKISALWFGGRCSWLFLQEHPGSESFPCPQPGSAGGAACPNTPKNVHPPWGCSQHTPVLLPLLHRGWPGWAHPRGCHSHCPCAGCAARLLSQ